MSSRHPEPLTPPDCDLRAFRDMPLDVQRFRDSDLVTEEEPEVVIAALWLWTAAWHQVPAASLPNDDRALSRFAGYGRSLTAWRGVRDGALRGFVLCSDGRLYHRVLAQKAAAAWRKRLEYEWGKAKDRHRKAVKNLPEAERPEFPDLDDWIAGRPAPERPEQRQQNLPLETGGNSSGTIAPSARTSGHGARAHTGSSSVPDGNSTGNDGEFRRNAPAIPLENALKGREGKGSIDSHSHSHVEDSRDPESEGEGGDDSPLRGADLLTLYEAVCDAAGFHPISPDRQARAQNIVKGWKDRGLDFETVVLPAIRHVMAQSDDRTRTLTRFRDEIDHRAARKAAQPKPKRGPVAKPLLEPPDEDERFRPLRAQLLERLGPQTFALVANEVRFIHMADMPDHRSPVLVVKAADQRNGRAPIMEGVYSSVVRNLATAAGYKEVW